MRDKNKKGGNHSTTYLGYVLVWISLIALTSITVSIAGINFGEISLAIALFIAAVKSFLVISIFMHIRYEDPIFKVFLLLSLLTLVIIFILTFFDFSFR